MARGFVLRVEALRSWLERVAAVVYVGLAVRLMTEPAP
jgi:threonine/homoserine/homoserine lactone efflux protein